jgi:hypothetical protein
MSDTLRELSALCQQLRDAEREQKDAEEALKVKKADVYRLSTEDIPTLMQELGVSKIRLETGEQIEVKQEIEASLPKEDLVARQNAFAWLEANGHGGLIKTEVTAQFGREELDKAQRALELLTAEYPEASVMLDRNIHTSTLKAFIKERLAAGEDLPLELFMARPYNKAKIK